MTTRTPEVGKLVLPGQRAADLAEAVLEIAVDYTVGQLCELAITMVDPKTRITRAATSLIGTTVTFDGKPWQVGTVESTLTEAGALLVLRARDPLAKGLRKKYRTSAEKKVSPGQWVTGRVTAAGGTAIVQPSAKRGTIAQSKNQSVLDVISALAGDLEWDWTSYDNTFRFGSAYVAWQGGLGSSTTWRVTWKQAPASDALTATWNSSDDDSGVIAELDLELPYEYGKAMRPWHRLASTIPGATGTWLVTDVSIKHDGVTPVQVKAQQPKKPSPKPGSSSRES